MQIEFAEAVIVIRFHRQHHLLQRHHVLILAGALQHQFRRLVGNGADVVVERVLTYQILEVLGHHTIDPVTTDGQRGASDVALDGQGQVLVTSGAVLKLQSGGLDVLVEGHQQLDLRPFRHQHVAGISLGIVFDAGVLGILIGDVDLLDLGQIVETDAELLGTLLAVLHEVDVIDHVFLHGRHEITVGGTVTAAGVLTHRQFLPVDVVGLHAQLNLAGHRIGHAGHNRGRIAALHGDIARLHTDQNFTRHFDSCNRRGGFRREGPQQPTGTVEQGVGKQQRGGGDNDRSERRTQRHPGISSGDYLINLLLLFLHVNFGIGPQLTDELRRDAAHIRVQGVGIEFQRSEQALFQIGNPTFDILRHKLIVRLHAPDTEEHMPDGSGDTSHKNTEECDVTTARGLPPGFQTTEQQDQRYDSDDRQTDLLQHVQSAAPATEGAEGLAQIFECWRCHRESSCLCDL